MQEDNNIRTTVHGNVIPKAMVSHALIKKRQRLPIHCYRPFMGTLSGSIPTPLFHQPGNPRGTDIIECALCNLSFRAITCLTFRYSGCLHLPCISPYVVPKLCKFCIRFALTNGGHDSSNPRHLLDCDATPTTSDEEYDQEMSTMSSVPTLPASPVTSLHPPFPAASKIQCCLFAAACTHKAALWSLANFVPPGSNTGYLSTLETANVTVSSFLTHNHPPPCKCDSCLGWIVGSMAARAMERHLLASNPCYPIYCDVCQEALDTCPTQIVIPMLYGPPSRTGTRSIVCTFCGDETTVNDSYFTTTHSGTTLFLVPKLCEDCSDEIPDEDAIDLRVCPPRFRYASA